MKKPDYIFIEGQLVHYYKMWRSSKSKRDHQMYQSLVITMINGLGYSENDIRMLQSPQHWPEVQLTPAVEKLLNTMLL